MHTLMNAYTHICHIIHTAHCTHRHTLHTWAHPKTDRYTQTETCRRTYRCSVHTHNTHTCTLTQTHPTKTGPHTIHTTRIHTDTDTPTDRYTRAHTHILGHRADTSLTLF